MQILYTMGYLAGRADKKLRDLITMGIPVVDTRYNPESKHHQWTKGHLETIPGLNYHWIQELGNINYKAALTGDFTEADIRIKDIDAGIYQLANVLNAHGKACLLCACSSKNRCHRSTVAKEAVDRLGVKIIHI
jgi:uncharacterized protein (DUF488 family)